MPSIGSTPRQAPVSNKSATTSFRNYSLATVVCAVTTILATPLSERFDLANIVMLFLLAVVIVALYLGRGASVWAAFLSVACFDFFFVPPKYTFSVDDQQYLLTFAIMLIVALVIGHLTGGIRQQAHLAARRERRAHALYEMARELVSAVTAEDVAGMSSRFVREAINARSILLLPDKSGRPQPAQLPQDEEWRHLSMQMITLAFDGTVCTDIDAPQPVGYFPLKTATRVRGVLAVASSTESAFPLQENQEFLAAVAALTAIAVERLQTGV